MDLRILLYLQELRNTYGAMFWEVLSSHTMLALYMAVGAGLLLAGERKKGYRILLASVSAQWIVHLLKNFFCIPRPFVREPRLTPSRTALEGAGGFSFPSGHSAAASSALFPISRSFFKGEKWFKVFCCLLVALTMLSRMMLSVHTPQDVLGGLLVGLAAVVVADVLIYSAKKRKPEVLLAIGVGAGIGLMLFTLYKPYPIPIDDHSLRDALKTAGAVIGFTVGWYGENRYDLYVPVMDRREFAIRVIVGAVLAGGVYAVMKLMPIPYIWQGFAEYSLALFTLLWPAGQVSELAVKRFGK